jgi:hypothetical protein
MLHLLKKVYLTSDRAIDIDLDRVVISKNYGIKPLNSITVEHGLLINYSKDITDIVGADKDYSDITDMITTLAEFCENSQKRVIIYADDSAFVKIIAYWYKLTFRNIDSESAKLYLDNSLSKFYTFESARANRFATTDTAFSIDTSSFDSEFKSATPVGREEFLGKYLSDISVEGLLASYLYNGSAKQELKASLTPLISKDLEKYLYELKEIFFTHFTTRRLADKLSLDKHYDWTNLTTIFQDQSRFGELFINDRIWNKKTMYTPTAGDNVKLSNITQADVQAFRDFAVIAGSTWDEESSYVNVKSDINKLDFLGVVTDFSDELLDTIIDVESSFEHAAGSFFSIDLETVNHYFIEALLTAKNSGNSDFLSKHSVV